MRLEGGKVNRKPDYQTAWDVYIARKIEAHEARIESLERLVAHMLKRSEEVGKRRTSGGT
jgi:hypothetical protein